MAAEKNIIDFLGSNMSILSELILDTTNFKKLLLDSLQKIGQSDFDFSYGMDEDSVADVENANESIIEHIQRYSNFNGDEGTSSLFKNLSPQYWNKSVKDAIKNFQDLVPESPVPPQELIGNSYFTYEDLIKANAGYTFINSPFSSNPVQTTSWVRPNINMYSSTYGQVRNEGEITGDGVLSVLRRISNLNFTHTQEQPINWDEISKNIRLIMPKNSHRVEIEDLNRNFWVITQCIAAISSFLFGDPEKNYLAELEKILDEMLQLWDNILWLWVLLLAVAAEQNQLHIELVTTYEGSLSDWRSCERHLDNFSIRKPIVEVQYQNTLNVLADKYPNRNLIILLQERRNNYMWNYYKEESYPYLCVKFRKSNEWKKFVIAAHIPAGNIFPYEDAYDEMKFSIDDFFGQNISSKIGQLHENGRRQIYQFPATAAAVENERWFGLLRITPRIECHLDENDIVIDSFTFTIFDAASQGQRTRSSTGEEGLFNGYLYKFTLEEPMRISVDTPEDFIVLKGSDGQIPGLLQSESAVDMGLDTGQSLYIGELVSKCLST